MPDNSINEASSMKCRDLPILWFRYCLICVLLTGGFASTATAQVVIAEHIGDTDPTSQEWELLFSSAGRGPRLTPIDDDGTPAWQIDEITGGNRNFAYYQQNFDDALADDANAYGWSLSARMRLPDFSTVNNGPFQKNRITAPSIVFRDSTTSRVWFVGFGLSNFTDGNPVVQTLTGVQTFTSLGPTFELENNDSYFDVELRFDPVAGSSDLFIDGTEVISDYESFEPPQTAEMTSVEWGDVSGGDVGVANFNHVAYTIHTFPAQPIIEPNPIFFGDLHVGQPAEQEINIANDVTAGNFSEHLVSTATSEGAATFSGGPSVTLAPTEVNNSLRAFLDTSTAGEKTGQIHIANRSVIPNSAAGGSDRPDLELDTVSIPIAANVYRLAEPTIQNAEAIDFGIVHVGDQIAPVTLAIQNSSVDDGFSENLDARIRAADVGIVPSTAQIDDLRPGETDRTALTIGIDTAVASTVNGSVLVDFASDGTGLNTLDRSPLTSQSVSVSAIVNQYANAVVTQTAGDNSFEQIDDTTYSLDFGSVIEGTTGTQSDLRLTNLVNDPADYLAGTWVLSADDFETTGFAPIERLDPNAQIDLAIALDPNKFGEFNGEITLLPRSENESGFSLEQDTITISVRGEVIQLGDFNEDGLLDVFDLDALTNAIAGDVPFDPKYDLTEDSVLNTSDLSKWLSHSATRNGFTESYLRGDSNLDGKVDSTDLNNLALSWQSEVTLWSEGDFNANGVVDSTDLNALAVNWRDSIPLASATHESVPEPTTWLLATICLVFFLGRHRPQNS